MNQYRMLCSSIWRPGLVAVGLLMGLGLPAIAQLPPPRPTGVYQPGYAFSRFTSHVERYLLNPQGFVSGLLLRNGIQVFLPPTLANSIVTIVQPGDRVTVYGVPGMQTNFGQVVQAHSITNTDTQRTVVAQTPLYSAPPYGPRGARGRRSLGYPRPRPIPPGPPPVYAPPGPPPAYSPPPGY